MAKKAQEPMIRFDGFEGTWEQRKLGEISEFITKGATPTTYGFSWQSDGVPFFRNDSIKDNTFVFGDFSYISEVANEVMKRSEVRSNDILVAITGDIGKVGIIPDSVKKANINQHIARVRIRKDALPYFIYQYLASDDAQKEYQKIKTGLAMPQLSLEQVRDIAVNIPKFNEQEKIADFFRSIDALIFLHQRKHDKLQIIKKAMLKKMFPTEGCSVPEIRFKEFSGAWKRRKLGDYIIEYTGKTTENNQYPPLTSSRKGLFLQTEYFAGNQIASKNNIGYNIVPYGYFTYRHMSDDEIFHFNINNIVENGIVSTLYHVFTTNEHLDSKYLQYQLNYGHEFAHFAILQKQGGSRTYMYLNKLKQLYLTMPSTVEEQKEIAEYLSNLDTLINLQQSKLDLLKGLKKVLLEKIFV